MNRKKRYQTGIYGLLALIAVALQFEPALAEKPATPPSLNYVDIAYGKARIINGHADGEEALKFIDQLIRQGHLQIAEQLLVQTAKKSILEESGRLDLELKLKEAQYFNHPDNQRVQTVYQQEIGKILLQLSQAKELPAVDIARYTETAEQFACGQAVVKFSLKLTELDPANSSRWWLKAGDWHLAANETKQALNCYRKAYADAQSDEHKHAALLAGLKAQWTLGQHREIEQQIQLAITKGKVSTQLQDLAKFALEIERPDLAWRLYGRLARINPRQGDHWRKETVRWAIAANQAASAALFLEGLPQQTFPPEQQDNLLYDRFTLLRHSNQLEPAVRLAQNLIPKRPKDVELLENCVQLALATQNISLADGWNRQLLRLTPKNKVALQRQADIAVARKDPHKAAEILRTLHAAAPDDKQILQQLALMEEWAGDPKTALVRLQNLSKIDNRIELHQQIYRLSLAQNDYPAALDALNHIATLRQLNKNELQARINLYEKIGEPEKGAAQTATYLAANPRDYQTWLELAHLQMRTRDYRPAIATWEQIAGHFGRNQQETLYRSECYWRLGSKREALEVIEGFQGKLSSPETLYQANLLVELGWRFRRAELALTSLSRLLQEYDQNQFFVVERLIYLQSEKGDIKEAVRIAFHSAQTTDDPRFLMTALKIAAADPQQQSVDSLLQRLKSVTGDLNHKPLYWTIQAQRKYAGNDYQGALEFYEKALALDKNSLMAQEGILWSLHAQGDRKKLAARLDQWQQAALEHQELWLVYAIAHQFLEKYYQAGIWYEHLISNDLYDYGILLGYADVLEAQGAADRAYRLRLWTMENLESDVSSFLETPQALTESVKSYVGLMHRYGSAQQKEYWFEILQNLKQGEPASPWLYQLAVGWHIEAKRHDQAKIWLAEAHRKRIQTPQWQEVSIALAENNQKRLAAALQKDSGLNLNQKAAVLEKLNRRRKALHLSETAIDPQRPMTFTSEASVRAAALKQDFPTNLRIGYATSISDQLESGETYLGGRYAFDNSPIGLDLTYRGTDYLSSGYLLEGNDRADDLAATAFLGNGIVGGSAAFGLIHHEADYITYGRLEYHHQLGSQTTGELKLDINTVPQTKSALEIFTLQKRLDAILAGTVINNYYYRIDLWGREFITRYDEAVAQGFGSMAEIGFKQNWGSLNWSVGLQANAERNFDRRLPDGLKTVLPENATIDHLVAEEANALLLGGRISRGDIRQKYPTAGSPRYFLAAWLGHTWPQNKPTANLRAGSGIRIFGHDELSLEAYYNQSGDVVGRNDDQGIAVQYRYYF